nr:response regulator [Polyangiaceae bacterium]
QIVVRTRCQNGQVLAEVEDTGSGIGPDLLPRLFEPFATTKEVGQGFGLGLFICHQTVTAFGGRIEVESKPGVGSLFKLWFPVGRAEKEPSEATQPPRDVVATLSEQLRVLVVDDEPQLRRVVRRALGKQCRVVEADSGERAKEILSHDRRFDAVICDLMMPGMSGMELYEWLTATLPELARRVVFMTGGVFTPRARELLEHAPNPVLPKPFDIEDVRNAVRLVVEDARDAGR